jgi:hypothetical protein
VSSPARPDDWSLWRSLAFLAAVFAVMLGSLLPFAAQAAATPGASAVICGPQGVAVVDVDGARPGDERPGDASGGPMCPACVMPLAAALPPPPPLVPESVVRPTASVAFAPARAVAPAMARAPPRPPSTAPPHA